MRRVLIAPDKFKGSLTGAQAAAALRRGIHQQGEGIEVRCQPVADGGEGTLEGALSAGFDAVAVTASGPTGLPIETMYARRAGTAVVELAAVSGLGLLPGGVPQPRTATSRGTGDLVAAALGAGCRHLVLGLGGSACTDGGAGLAQALGARVSDANGRDLTAGGAALLDVAGLQLDGLPPALADATVVVASDVDNPLTGPRGAAAVYGPQKGACPADITLLDAALARWADVVAATTGKDLRDEPGAGAAGGVGYGVLALLGARIRPGVEVVMELLDLQRHLHDVDLVVVGEGSLDEQSLHGKAPVGVARAARAAGTRVVAVCGRSSVAPERFARAGIEQVYVLSELEPDPARSMARAASLLEVVGARIARDHVGG